MIKEFFKNFDVTVKEVITALIAAEIFENINWSYRNAENKRYSHCRQYFLNENVMEMCYKSDFQYLLMLHTNKDFRRQENKNRSKRINNTKTEDFVCAYNSENIKNLVFSYDDLEAARAECEDNKNRLSNLNCSAIRLRNDVECEYHDKDGRMHNSFVSCPKVLRNRLTMGIGKKNILVNQGDVDYRSMHPTFFAHYVMTQLATDKLDLLDEYNDWNSFWTDPEVHPRTALMIELGLDANDKNAKDKFKISLLSVLNDENYNYELLIRNWIAIRFPKLFDVWFIQNHNKVRETGCNISKIYEKQLLRNAEFYEFAANLDCKILDCHDGVSVFCKKPEDFADISEKIIDFQVSLCQNLFGITPIITNK